jgi:purine-nucleoside phosphorylase
MTPHNRAKKQDIAKTVIMPGDPLRAKWIANKFLSKAKLVNNIRGMLAFTGLYKNKKITVMGHGMGIPSIGIYSFELYKFYDVSVIIRAGSCGAYQSDIDLGDVLIAKEASSFSIYPKEIGLNLKNNILEASPKLIRTASLTAEELNIKNRICRIFSSDSFYNQYSLKENIKRSGNASAVEMEAFGLYANALKLKKQALAILTCCDSLVTKEEMSAKEREPTFTDMVRLA